MSPTFLFSVEDGFQLQGIGCVLVPGIPMAPGFDVRPGAVLRLELPTGEIVDTHVAGFTSIRRTSLEHRRAVPLTLPKPLTKEQVPAGTHVFLIPEQNA